MRVSSAQEDDWSIISSSSDLDEDLSASYFQAERSENDQDEEFDHSSDVNMGGDESGVADSKAEESNQDASTHTITPRINSYEQKQIRNYINVGKSGGPKKANGFFFEYTCGYSAARLLSNKETAKDQPLIAQIGFMFGFLAGKFDKGVRLVSATGFDWTFGMLLLGLRHVKSSSECKSSGKTQGCNKFLTPHTAINISILALESLLRIREIWLYQLVLVLVAVFAFREIQYKPAPKKVPFTSILEYLSGGKSWKEVYDSAFYEDGPVSRNIFGFTTVGPKKVRGARYWKVIREKTQPIMTILQEKLWEAQEAMMPYLVIVQKEASKFGLRLIKPETWSSIDSFRVEKITQFRSYLEHSLPYCKQQSKDIADFVAATCNAAYKHSIKGYEHISAAVAMKKAQVFVPSIKEIRKILDAKITNMALAANAHCRNAVAGILGQSCKLTKSA